MKTLFKNATVINVFSAELERASVLVEDGTVVGVGDYTEDEADKVIDCTGKYVCPGFIDGHIHIESTMLSPAEFARACVSHGTTAVMADPHEIANVCGTDGIEYMLQASEGLPLTVYVMLPSCVPATPFCESGAILQAADLEPFYAHPRVLGLGEVMNYVGVLQDDESVIKKISAAKKHGAVINGHAPLLSGKALDKYISAGICDDHECTSAEEARERIRRGQRVMIRQGTAARNLTDMLPLFEAPWAQRCLLVSDDKHPADLLQKGHIDDAVRLAIRTGKNPVTAISMATLYAAQAFDLKNVGAIAPGYTADLLVLDSLEELAVSQVYKKGVCVAMDGKPLPFDTPKVDSKLQKTVKDSFHLAPLDSSDFLIDCNEKRKCRIISLVKGQLLTDEVVKEIDFSQKNGISLADDILKIAVIERHKGTGHKGIGFISGVSLKGGAIASSISHDSHNLIVIGTNEADMAYAANSLLEMGGGCISVCDGKALAALPLPIAGLMSECDARTVADQNEALRQSVHTLGAPADIEPFMNMAFVSLPVIPHLKMTTHGLIDVNRQTLVPLFVE